MVLKGCSLNTVQISFKIFFKDVSRERERGLFRDIVFTECFILGYFHCLSSSLCIKIIGEFINLEVFAWLTLIFFFSFSLFLVFISWIFSFSPNRNFIFSFLRHFLILGYLRHFQKF